jgi:hypothetical protein
MGVVLFKAQLGVIVNRMRHVKQHPRVPVDVVSDLGPKRFSGHPNHVTAIRGSPAGVPG